MKPSTLSKALDELKSPRERTNTSKSSLARKKPTEPSLKVKSNLPAYFLKQAEGAIREHPGCPASWKRNIRPFLLNCLKEIPYVSSWHWAIHAVKSWCRYAPFKYFREVLRNPTRFRLSGDTVTKFHDVEMYRWLVSAKGSKIANAYAKRQLMWNSQTIFTIDPYTRRTTKIDLSKYTRTEIRAEKDPQKKEMMELLGRLRWDSKAIAEVAQLQHITIMHPGIGVTVIEPRLI